MAERQISIVLRIARASRRSDSGFTLIELLVVIIILGILAAVVVFAVQGVGDKGHDNAVAIDERTIRTAEEAFCAREGHYAEIPELLDKGYLSDTPTYHDVVVLPGGTVCNGSQYTIRETDPDPTSTTTTTLTGGSSTTSSTLPAGACGQSGTFCTAAAPATKISTASNPSSMAVLPSGKVLAFGAFNGVGVTTALFDPAAGDTGAWAPGPISSPPGIEPTTSVRLSDDPALSGMGAGKVVVHFCCHPGHWELYDPLLNLFTRVPGTPLARNHDARAIQIIGTSAQCNLNCGKVLIVGQGGEGLEDRPATPPTAELYDPKANSFDTAGTYAGTAEKIDRPVLAQLNDGRILVAGTLSPGNLPWARIFDPLTGLFEDAETPPLAPNGQSNPAVTLADGSILVGPELLYKPDPRGSGDGTWTEKTRCGTSGPCFIMAVLANGKILANGNADAYRGGTSRDMYLFDPSNLQWTPTGSLVNVDSGGTGVLLSVGTCGSNCNKILVAGNKSAEVYTP